MATLPSVVNLCAMMVISAIVLCLWIIDKRINSTLQAINDNARVQFMKQSDEVVEPIYEPLYRSQTYNFNLESFFLDDIYKPMSEDVRVESIQNDYYKLFITAIDSILKYKKEFTSSFLYLDDPSALQYDYYRSCVKFAKFTLDYEGYLNDINSRKLSVLTESKYKDFSSDPTYFLLIDKGKCKKHVHILKVLEKAVYLYTKHKDDVDECLYNNKCHKPVAKRIMQDTCEST